MTGARIARFDRGSGSAALHQVRKIRYVKIAAELVWIVTRRAALRKNGFDVIVVGRFFRRRRLSENGLANSQYYPNQEQARGESLSKLALLIT